MSISANPYSHTDASAASVAQLRAAVKNMDALTQEACGGIEALGIGDASGKLQRVTRGLALTRPAKERS